MGDEAEAHEALADFEAGERAAQAALDQADALAGAAAELKRIRPVEDGGPVLIPGADGGHAIIAGLVKAMGLIEAIGKDSQKTASGRDDQSGSFSYRAADAVVTAANRALAEAGVLCVPNLLKSHRFDLGNQHVVTLRMEYRFYSAVDGSAIRVVMESSAVGRTAYTIGSGYSYAIKYALSQLLLIPFDDPRMDMESNESAGAGDVAPPARQAAPAGGEWWQRAGWESLEELAAMRQDVLDRMKALAPLHLEAMKRRLAELEPAMTFNPMNGQRMGKRPIWQPKNKSKPTGPGSIATGPLKAELARVVGILASVEADSAREAAGEEPFEVGASPRGEVGGNSPEGDAAVQQARQNLRERSRSRAQGARKGKASEEPERASVAPEPSESLLEGRAWLTEAMLAAEAGTAEQIRETLEDAELWPIDKIPEDRMGEALGLASGVLSFAGEGEDDEDEAGATL